MSKPKELKISSNKYEGEDSGKRDFNMQTSGVHKKHEEGNNETIRKSKVDPVASR